MKTFQKNDARPSIWKNPIHFIACGFGVGAIPFAPGTFGTLLAVPIFFALASLPLLAYLLIVFLYALLAIYCINRTDADWHTHDHPATVSDEIVGYLVAMIGIPATWPMALLGFVFFRIFDIFKPWPISWMDKNIKGGFGVVIDDVAAGVLTWIVLRIILYFYPI